LATLSESTITHPNGVTVTGTISAAITSTDVMVPRNNQISLNNTVSVDVIKTMDPGYEKNIL
jgi:hypothetical protein